MSSTISQTEIQAVPKEDVGDIQPKDVTSQAKILPPQQRPPLIRSSSVDKIIKFNAYICSQNYYILPSLLIWLKTSQNAFTNQTEKSITFLKSAIFAAALYKALEAHFKAVFPHNAARWLRAYGTCCRAARGLCLRGVPKAFSVLLGVSGACAAAVVFLRARFAVIAIYASITIIGLQLFSCVVILCSVLVPNGLIFMVCCMYAMGHIAATAMFHHMREEAKKAKSDGCKGAVRASRAPAKPVLGDRTISNVNLL